MSSVERMEHNMEHNRTVRSWMPIALCVSALLAACDGSAARYEAGAACGGLSDMTAIRDAGVDALRSQAEAGRCTFHAEADDAAALARQQAMLQAVSVIACSAPAISVGETSPVRLALQLPARCPLASSTPLISTGRSWHKRQPFSIPFYPPAAIREQQEGRVELTLLLDAQGKPQAIIVARSTGHPLLDEAALKHARAWRYEYEAPGKPASMSLVRDTVDFKLN
ncbi:hypothetical protein C1933_03420 [Stenotrophomonas sp. ZAC14D2_NAIMI4_6]|nr:hypothetical protein C1933_03420 [Stenotrophomonas sp. ZAC14D2_NAIMI4_6]